jgi:hypothetical protein
VVHLQLAPHSPKSGGKPLKKKRRTKRTSRAGQALPTAAVTLGRSATALGAYYRHIARKKGPDVAVFATARKLGTLAYRLLRWGQEYVDIGQKAYEELYQKARLRALAKTASQLGYQLPKTEVTTRWDSRRNGSTVDPTGHALRCRPRNARGFPPNF